MHINRTTIIQQIIDKIGGKTYLEIGVKEGINFRPIKSKIKIGVDPQINKYDLKSTKEVVLFNMTSDDFFSKEWKLLEKNKIDVAFIDGLHECWQVLRDVRNCLCYLNEGGVIILHDCIPLSEIIATPYCMIDKVKSNPEWKGQWAGDVWKAVTYLRALRKDLNIFVLNLDCGLAIITKGQPENRLNYSVPEIEKMDYRYFANKKENLLNIKDINFFNNFLQHKKPIFRYPVVRKMALDNLRRLDSNLFMHYTKYKLNTRIKRRDNRDNLPDLDLNFFLKISEDSIKDLGIDKRLLNKMILKFKEFLKNKQEFPLKTYIIMSNISKLAGNEKEAEEIRKSIPRISENDSNNFLKIWNFLNKLEERKDNGDAIQSLNGEKIHQYFSKNSNYKVMGLFNLGEAEEKILDNHGIYKENLKLDSSWMIRNDNVTRIPSSCSAYPPMSRNLEFQQMLIEDKKIYCVCPYTGSIVGSDCSIFNKDVVCYRFESKKVFYVITAIYGEKLIIFLPEGDIIIKLRNEKIFPLLDKYSEDLITSFKSFMVENWQNIEKYIESKKNKIAAIIDFSNHPGHQLINDLGGIQRTYEHSNLKNIDAFIVLLNEAYGKIDGIYPEIPKEKIKRFTRKEAEKFLLENEYFVLKLEDHFVREELAKRVISYSFYNSSKELQRKIEEAKRYSPLVWIGIRTGDRYWVSQKEGIIKIIKKLHAIYPNIAFILSGFAMPEEINEKSSPNFKKFAEKLIKDEKEIASEIKNSIPKKIRVYDIIGCKMHESVLWADAITFYISPWGGSSVQPMLIANKLGIIHASKGKLINRANSVYSWVRENPTIPYFADSNFVFDTNEINFNSTKDFRDNQNNYEVYWREIYNKSLQICRELGIKKFK